MPRPNHLLSDGQFSWAGGVQSDTPRTKVIPGLVDDGVQLNQAAWLNNCSVRGGGIGQRPTLQPLVQDAPWAGRYQGAMLYQPDYGDPILLMAVGGNLYRVRVDYDNSVENLTATYGPGLEMPADQPLFFFKQAEMFAIIQCGDYITNPAAPTSPLFYDLGVPGLRPETLRRSAGFIGVGNPGNEIPGAGPMDYFGNRLWYGFGRGYAAGDIVSNQVSGTAAYDYRDSVLHVTENPVAYAGDAFRLPTNAGDVRAIAHAANIDSELGDAQFYVFTRRAVYSCDAPVTRDDWTATDFDNEPIQKVALTIGGTYSHRCVVTVNGDLFFQGPPNGDIRTIQTAQRQWNTWGSVPLSTNINRLLLFNDRGLLRYASGINYDNWLLQTALPTAIPGVGVGFQCIAPLSFDVISTFEERRPPAWEGVWDFSGGPLILELLEGDFGGRQRAFAVVWSVARSQIEVWEVRNDLRWDNGDNRVTRIIELPAYSFGDPMQLKELDSAVFWFDKMLSKSDVQVFYRPDSYACWQPWTAFQTCTAKDCAEYVTDPCIDNGYPVSTLCEADAIPVRIGPPPYPGCKPASGAPSRPLTLGYQFQVRLVIKGWVRLRSFILYAKGREEPAYYGLACQSAPTGI